MADSSRWTEVRLHVDSVDAPTVSEALIRAGATGTWLQDYNDRVVVVGYFAPGVPAQERLATLRESLPGIAETLSPELRPRDTESWETVWRDQFQPVRIGDRWQVQAPWHPKPVEPGLELIVIEPGMAFGTGLHATTQMCLEALSHLPLVGATVFDVGTGSGVLAVAACLARARRVLASDCDPRALDSARRNLVRNGVADKVQLLLGRGLAGVVASPEVVIANLSSTGVLDLAEEMTTGRLRPQTYVCSGIPARRATEVETGLRKRGFGVVRRRTAGEWVSFETCAVRD